jgi:uncharacterized damage-inducible protein DinB
MRATIEGDMKPKARSKPHSEPARIADQLKRAFYGSAWHGPALMELLKGVDAHTAAARPLADVHSIWELVLHIAAWDGAASRRIEGHTARLKGLQNFPLVPQPSEDAWREAVAATKRTHDALVATVASLPASRLRERCPGKPYDLYHLLHGVVQHELYHAGQIAILKKAQTK